MARTAEQIRADAMAFVEREQTLGRGSGLAAAAAQREASWGEVGAELGKGLVRGATGLGSAVGTGISVVGGWTGSQAAKQIGDSIKQTWNEVGAEWERGEVAQGNVVAEDARLTSPSTWINDDSALFNAAAWAANVGEFLPSVVTTGGTAGIGFKAGQGLLKIGPKLHKVTPNLMGKLARLAPVVSPKSLAVVAGGASGGVMEASSVYQEVLEKGGTEEDARKAWTVMTLASGVLNALPLSQIVPSGVQAKAGLTAAMGRAAGAGASEALTEYLETPLEMFSLERGGVEVSPEEWRERMRQGVDVVPLSFAFGAAGGAGGRPAFRGREREAGAEPETPAARPEEAPPSEEAAAPEPEAAPAEPTPETGEQPQAPVAEPEVPRGTEPQVEPEEDLLAGVPMESAADLEGAPAPTREEIAPSEFFAPVQEETSDAGRVREDEEQVSARGPAEGPSAEESRQDLEQPAPGEPRDQGAQGREEEALGEPAAGGVEGARPVQGRARDVESGERQPAPEAAAETAERPGRGPGGSATRAPKAAKPEAKVPEREAEKGALRAPESVATPRSPVKVQSSADLESAREGVETAPSEAQKAAGNYTKAHIEIQGLDIALENPKGSVRTGTDRTGKTWSQTMALDYGYVKRTTGADGDHVDVFVGPKPESRHVYVVDQRNPDGTGFDEHKAMLGFDSVVAARKGYLANYEKGWKGVGPITRMSQDQFKAWLADEAATKRPARYWMKTEGRRQARAAIEAQEQARGNEPTDVSERPEERPGREAPGAPEEATQPREPEPTGPPAPEGEPSAAPTVGTTQPPEYGSSNKVFTRELAEAAAARIRAKAKRMHSGFDPELATDLLAIGGYHVEAGTRRFADWAARMVEDLGEFVRPYLRGTYKNLRADPSFSAVLNDMDSDAVVDKLTEAPAPKGKLDDRELEALTLAFAEHLQAGHGFENISQARTWAAEHLGHDIKAGTLNAKLMEEALESGAVEAGRAIVRQGLDEGATYDALVELHGRLPNLSTRTSESVAYQAYSTPLPIAYVASRLAGIGPNTTVYEPAAGHGALLMEAEGGNVTANEINPRRGLALERHGFTVSQEDGTVKQPPQADVVIANPPFGVTKEDGRTRRWALGRGYETAQIDHAMAIRALESLGDEGRAVLILGSVKHKDKKARSDAYHAKAKREFYARLYGDYNVVNHFTVAGELYTQQGAGWPVDVVVINGRGKTPHPLPAADLPDIIESYGALRNALAHAVPAGGAPESVGATGEPEAGPGVAGGPAPGPAAREAEPEGISEPAGEPAPSPVGGERGGRAGRDGEDLGRGGPGQRESEAAPAAGREPGSGRRESEDVGEARAVDRGVAGGRVSGEPTAGGARRSGAARPGGVGHAREPGRDGDRLATGQTPYAPASARPGDGTLTPTNLFTSMVEALNAVVDRRGDLDQYVADSLGFTREEVLDGRFLGEQIDALALGLDNLERQTGFIIGDQTGIGKGRVVAGMIRYALRQGKVPVFVTEKPNLYADMYRDLTDIGQDDVRPLATNASFNLALDREGAVRLKTKGAAAHNALLDELVEAGNLGEHNMVFTTYSQMQTLRGSTTARMRFLAAQAPNAFFIFDESHNAGGSEKGEIERAMAEKKAPDRAAFARELAGSAWNVFFSSATYAKRPSVMDLYARTDMSLAVSDPKELGEAIQKGGVPLQQAVASMLAQAGQYVRRERSFEGIEYETRPVPVDRPLYDRFAGLMAGINRFQTSFVAKATEAMKSDLKAGGGVVGPDGSIGFPGVDSLNFTAIMHNLVEQMLLAIKAEQAAEIAVAELEAGRTPVITLANTMGSFLDEYVTDTGLAPGDAVGLSFGDLAERYLNRTREVTVGAPFSKAKEKVYLDDAALGEAGVAFYDKLLEQIRATDFSSMPVSPIDAIHAKLRAAGYKTDEITGRSRYVEFDGEGNAILRGRQSTPKTRKSAIEGFNSGAIDALIINQAGSTGISLHASEKFADQRPRSMVLAQPERNIDTHMQMLGRVNRTGQTSKPRYFQLMADVPAENRPAANLATKMASLNANTTGARGGKFAADSVLDFMNEYGDQVVAEMMNDDRDFHRRIGKPLKEHEEEGFVHENAARRVSGRVPMLPLADQEAFYETLEANYSELIDNLNATGQNALEARTVDLQARTLESESLVEGQAGIDSPFAAGAELARVDVKRQGKPYPTTKVLEQVARTAKTQVPAAGDNTTKLEAIAAAAGSVVEAQTTSALAEFDVYAERSIESLEDEKAQSAEQARLAGMRTTWLAKMREFAPGTTYQLDINGSIHYGVVAEVARKGKAKNPLAPGQWKVKFLLTDASRQYTAPFSRLRQEGEGALSALDEMLNKGQTRVRRTDTAGVTEKVIDAFDTNQQAVREERYMVTGNVLAGFAAVKGKGSITNYTDAEGNIRQGILMPRSFDKAAAEKARPLEFQDPGDIVQFLSAAPVVSADNAVTIRQFRSSKGAAPVIRIEVARSKRQGGQYYLNERVRDAAGDFTSVGPVMRVDLDPAAVRPAIEALQAAGATFAARSHHEVAQRILGGTSRGPQAYQTRTQPRGMSAALVGRIVQSVRRRWPGAPEIRVVATQAELPGEAAPAGTYRAGLYADGTIYLVAANLNNRNHVLEVLAHEAVGHASMEDMLGTQWEGVAREVNRLADEGPLADVAGEVSRRYGERQTRDTRAAEIIALLAERRVREGAGARILRRVRELFRAALTRMGLTRSFTATDLDRLITEAGRRLERRRSGSLISQGVPRYSQTRAGQNPTGQHPETVHGMLSRDLESKVAGTEGAYAAPNGEGGFDVVIYFDARTGKLHQAGPQRTTVANKEEARAALAQAGFAVRDRNQEGGAPKDYAEQADMAGPDIASANYDLEMILAEGDWVSRWQRAAAQIRTESRSAGDKAGAIRLFARTTKRAGGAFGHKVRRGLEDRFLNLDHQQRLVAKARKDGTLPDDMNALMAETRYHGKTRAKLEAFEKDRLRPMMRDLAKSKVSIDDFELYLWARHAPEANQRLAEINPDAPLDKRTQLSGKSNEEAAADIERLEGRYGQDTLRRLEGHVRRIADERLTMVSPAGYGLESQETVDNWRNTYQHYIPLYRHEEGDLPSELGTPRGGKGYSTRGPESRARTGSERAVGNILAHLTAQYESTIMRGEKNEVVKTMFKLAKENPSPNLWTVRAVERTKVVDKNTGFVVQRSRPLSDQDRHVVSMKFNGRPAHIVFNRRNPTALNIADALKRVGVADVGRVLGMIHSATRFLASMNTMWNPEFLVTNVIRDFQAAGLNIASSGATDELSAAESAKFHARVMRDSTAAARGILNALRGDGTGVWADRYRQLESHGGTTGWSQAYETLSQKERKLRGMLRQEGGNVFSFAKRQTAEATLGVIRDMGQTAENAMRLSIFWHAQQAGASPERAAVIAKNITVNFNRKGEWSTAVNALYMFANASVQGNLRFLRAITPVYRKNGKIRMNAKGVAVMGTLATIGVIMDVLNRMLSGDDEDGNNYYDQIPHWVKERNFILSTGGEEYMAIPMPYGYSTIVNFGQKMSEAFFRHGDPTYNPTAAGAEWVGSAASSFSPVGGYSTLLQFVSPTVTDPIAQWSENKDWLAKRIRPDQPQYGPDKPAHMLFYGWKTSQLSQDVTAWASEVTGGDPWQEGVVELNPALLDHLTGSIMGGTGTFLSKAAGVVERATKSDAEILSETDTLDIHQAPFVRKFVKRVYPQRQRDQFYETSDRLRQLRARQKGYQERLREAATPEEAASARSTLSTIQQRHGAQLGLRTRAERLRKRIGKFRKQIDQIRGSELAPQVKRRRIGELEAIRNRLIKQFNRDYAEAIGEEAA